MSVPKIPTGKDPVKNSATWDFSKLPGTEHARVVELYTAGKFWEIVRLHDKYQLSGNTYCCSNTLKGVKAWIEYGIETGQIKK